MSKLKTGLIIMGMSMIFMQPAYAVLELVKPGNGTTYQNSSTETPPVNLKNDIVSGILILKTFRLNPYATGQNIEQTNDIEVIDPIETLTLEPVSIDNYTRNYPNPFRQDNGTTIYYFLNRAADITIKIYDMRAREIFSGHYPSSIQGGQQGHNRVRLDNTTLSGYSLPSGVYFYVIMNEGKVLGKGKMAVVP